MTSTTQKNVLVSGASFAGLSTAYWMNQLGYQVTIVELAPALRRGGTAVDIRGKTVDVVARMGILDQIKANRLALQRWEFKNADDVTEGSLVLRQESEAPADDELEIERNALLDILYDAVKDDVTFIFSCSIESLIETAAGVEVVFSEGSRATFDLVLGCDGIHSAVRKLWFGREAEYSQFLGQYFSITIVDKLLITRDTAQMFNVPGKAVMLNAYKDNTDIVLCFASDREIPYDFRDEEQQRALIREQFSGLGWRTPELLAEVEASESFYFDKLVQIRMSSWSKGRIALVGDAGYCASPAAGMGGSLAIEGAAALGDAFRRHGSDFDSAFRDYEQTLRPFVDEVQADAIQFGLDNLVPRTEEAIRKRNSGDFS